jgi:hypothetical protein
MARSNKSFVIFQQYLRLFGPLGWMGAGGSFVLAHRNVFASHAIFFKP